MKFENTFNVDAPIDEVYDTMVDLEKVAPCVPGAEVLERTGDDSYQVAIKIKVGPMSMTYRGTVEIVERDAEAHTAQMRARAKEARGQGTAQAEVLMALQENGSSTQGTMTSDVKLSGRVASMGRGIIEDVSARIIDTFSDNLEAMLAGGGEAAAAAEGPAEAAAAEGAAGEPEPATTAAPGPPPAAEAPPRPAPAAAPAEDEGFPLIGVVGPVIGKRLRDPRVVAGIVVTLGLVLLLRRLLNG
jgi:uncharacterized protein